MSAFCSATLFFCIPFFNLIFRAFRNHSVRLMSTLLRNSIKTDRSYAIDPDSLFVLSSNFFQPIVFIIVDYED